MWELKGSSQQRSQVSGQSSRMDGDAVYWNRTTEAIGGDGKEGDEMFWASYGD